VLPTLTNKSEFIYNLVVEKEIATATATQERHREQVDYLLGEQPFASIPVKPGVSCVVVLVVVVVVVVAFLPLYICV
jgi:hypothetical protein